MWTATYLSIYLSIYLSNDLMIDRSFYVSIYHDHDHIVVVDDDDDKEVALWSSGSIYLSIDLVSVFGLSVGSILYHHVFSLDFNKTTVTRHSIGLSVAPRGVIRIKKSRRR